VAVHNSIKVGPLVILLQMFVITENIMKRPVELILIVTLFLLIALIFCVSFIYIYNTRIAHVGKPY
jgi:hypothetical protein